MSLTTNGTWKANVWASTVWKNGVWYEVGGSSTPTTKGGYSGEQTIDKAYFKRLRRQQARLYDDEEVLAILLGI